ncbi:MAG: hypothetical protein P8M72_12095 [Gammaproteobacteria bacterium]|nr:hypothetical protein [Gammaproteobacteria bacterium]
MLARILILITCVGFALPAMSQTGHPAKGSWSGDLTSFSSAEPVRIRLLLDAMSGELSGTVNPGRRGVEMTSVELDAENWGLTIVADMPDGTLMLEGKLSNIGSWTDRKYRGSYTQGNTKGTFDISLN